MAIYLEDIENKGHDVTRSPLGFTLGNKKDSLKDRFRWMSYDHCISIYQVGDLVEVGNRETLKRVIDYIDKKEGDLIRLGHIASIFELSKETELETYLIKYFLFDKRKKVNFITEPYHLSIGTVNLIREFVPMSVNGHEMEGMKKERIFHFDRKIL